MASCHPIMRGACRLAFKPGTPSRNLPNLSVIAGLRFGPTLLSSSSSSDRGNPRSLSPLSFHRKDLCKWSLTFQPSTLNLYLKPFPPSPTRPQTFHPCVSTRRRTRPTGRKPDRGTALQIPPRRTLPPASRVMQGSCASGD